MPLTRRETLKMLGAGFGVVGLAEGLVAQSDKRPHFAARAKRIIFLYLNGGLSHVDSFDPKPALTKFDGQPMPGPKIKTDRASGGLMQSPFQFRPCGESLSRSATSFRASGRALTTSWSCGRCGRRASIICRRC